MKIALVADVHLSLCGQNKKGCQLAHSCDLLEAVIDDINSRKPDIVIWMGDLTHDNTDEVFKRFADILSRIRVPTIQMIGNHDVLEYPKAGITRFIPIVHHQWFAGDGWNVMLLDTTREFDPLAIHGCLSDTQCRAIRTEFEAASDQPWLVLAHHPLCRLSEHDRDAFYHAVSELSSTKVMIAGHTHVNRYEQTEQWHFIEISSVIEYPVEYHWLELAPSHLALICIQPDVGRIRDQARQDLLDLGWENRPEQTYGSPEARQIHIALEDNKTVPAATATD